MCVTQWDALCWHGCIIRCVYFPMVKAFALVCHTGTGSNVQMQRSNCIHMRTITNNPHFAHCLHTVTNDSQSFPCCTSGCSCAKQQAMQLNSHMHNHYDARLGDNDQLQHDACRCKSTIHMSFMQLWGSTRHSCNWVSKSSPAFCPVLQVQTNSYHI